MILALLAMGGDLLQALVPVTADLAHGLGSIVAEGG